MDLGYKHPEPTAISQAPDEAPKVHYPGFSIRDHKMNEFLADHPCTVGDTCEGRVKLKVTGHNQGDYDKSLSFDILEFEPEKKSGMDRLQDALAKIAK